MVRLFRTRGDPAIKPTLRTLACAAILSPLWPTLAQAQPNTAPPAPPAAPQVIPKDPIIDPAAKALIVATIAKYKALKSYSDTTMVTGIGMDSQAKITWERPSRSRVEAKIGKKEGFGLNDGTTLWAINPRYPGFYVQRDGEKNRVFDAIHESGIGAPGNVITQGDTPFEDFMRDGLYKLEMGLPEEFEGVATQVVRVHLAFDDGHRSLMSLYIGKEDGLLYQIRQSVDDVGMVLEVHRNVQADPVLPPETWQWTPPTDLKKTEYFSSLTPDFLSTYKPGQKMPEITSNDLNGKPVTLSDFKGKAVVLYFLAVKSGEYAVDELTELQKQAGPEKLAIVCVSMDGRRDRVQEFVEKYKFPYPILFDGQGWGNGVAQTLGVNSHPLVFLIDKEGTIQQVSRRSADMAFYEDFQKLVN